MVYMRVNCEIRGTCNKKGHDGTCTKCGKRPTGGIWWFRFRFLGRMIHESSHSRSKTVALQAERERRRQLEESWNNIKKRTMPPTFGQAKQAWLEKHNSIDASTRETYKYALKHLAAFFGNDLVCDIYAEAVTAYQNHRIAQKAAGATINKEFSVLGSILADHGQWSVIRRNVRRVQENESAGRATVRRRR